MDERKRETNGCDKFADVRQMAFYQDGNPQNMMPPLAEEEERGNGRILLCY